MRVHLNPIARRDVLEDSDYYADLSDPLAERFVEEIKSALKQLRDHPELGSPRYDYLLPDRSLRMWQLDRFPFLVLYKLEKDCIDMLRVLHERRDISATLINQ